MIFREETLCKLPETPDASLEAGSSHSLALCMTFTAIHSGQRVRFDDSKQEVVGGGTPVSNC